MSESRCALKLASYAFSGPTPLNRQGSNEVLNRNPTSSDPWLGDFLLHWPVQHFMIMRFFHFFLFSFYYILHILQVRRASS